MRIIKSVLRELAYFTLALLVVGAAVWAFFRCILMVLPR